MFLSNLICLNLIFDSLITFTDLEQSSTGTVKVRLANFPSSVIFCTIISTLILALDNKAKIFPAIPGLSGIPFKEIFASLSEEEIPVTTSFSNFFFFNYHSP